jgi:hypothetical protein
MQSISEAAATEPPYLDGAGAGATAAVPGFTRLRPDAMVIGQPITYGEMFI